MKSLTLEELIGALNGTCDQSAPAGSAKRVCIDSRTVQAGDLFVAIRGERFDGHRFVSDALARGAMAAVVREDFAFQASSLSSAQRAMTLPPNGLIIRVDQTVAALGRLARYYRRSIIDGAVTVVGVTGSNGKTTTKTMIAHILSNRWQGRASAKSFNNEIGVPLTLLSVEPSDDFVIAEIGTNAPGEIAALGRLVEPEVAVITTVSEAHLEGLGSLAQIAEEKVSLLHQIRPGGCAILNADCEILRQTVQRDRDLRELKCITFGRDEDADLRLTDLRVGPVIEFTVNDRFKYKLSVPGRHNVGNALAAIAVARRFGMVDAEIAERLATFQLPPMRLQSEQIGSVTVINDAYNANPASLAAAVDVLTDMPVEGRRVLIVGDMRELGSASEQLHEQAAERIARSGVDLVIAIGQHARRIGKTIRMTDSADVETHAYVSVASARRRLVSHLRPADTIMMKGSRLLELEKLLPVIREWAAPDASSISPKKSSRNKRRLTA